MTAEAESTGQIERSLEDLYRRPGFLIRRSHQITVALFLEESAELGMTTTQYGVMVILRARQNLDQVGLATLVGIDRSTTALVVGKLEESRYVERGSDPADKRRKVLVLTPAGHAMLDKVAEPARRARERALAAFSPDEATQFLDLLQRFVETFNDKTRAPIKPRPTKKRHPRGTLPPAGAADG